jgi:hypothetical protein
MHKDVCGWTSFLSWTLGGTLDEGVTDLTRRYGEEYAARWPRFFASMAWNHLQNNLNLPKG